MRVIRGQPALSIAVFVPHSELYVKMWPLATFDDQYEQKKANRRCHLPFEVTID
jgi:hypothetical protein